MDRSVTGHEITASRVSASKDIRGVLPRYILLRQCVGAAEHVVILADIHRLVVSRIESVGVVVRIHGFLANQDDVGRAPINLGGGDQ